MKKQFKQPTAPLLWLDGVSGGYSIHRPVLHNLSFRVNSGEMVALIGLNGAGKSTTMKHILGLLKPHQGTIQIADQPTEERPGSNRTSLAYVPETPLLYDELTVWEHLELSARAYGLTRDIFLKRADRLLATFQMGKARDRLSIHLSKGMQQKVMIMCAFLVDPPIYIIDEPFIGLDPLAIRAVLEMMEEKKRAGAGLLISSHILSMIEKYADRFVVLHEGNILVDGAMDAVCEQAGAPGCSLEEAFYQLVEGGDHA